MGLIYLDACLLIYLAERHPRWSGPVVDTMACAEGDGFGISPPVKCECLVGPIRRGDPVLERAYTELLGLFVLTAVTPPASRPCAARQETRFRSGHERPAY